MSGAGYSRPLYFTNKTASDCQPALVETKKAAAFPGPLKETNTDTPLMHEKRKLSKIDFEIIRRNLPRLVFGEHFCHQPAWVVPVFAVGLSRCITNVKT